MRTCGFLPGRSIVFSIMNGLEMSVNFAPQSGQLLLLLHLRKPMASLMDGSSKKPPNERPAKKALRSISSDLIRELITGSNSQCEDKTRTLKHCWIRLVV